MDRQKNPKQYPDSIYQKKLSDLKAGNLKDGKIPHSDHRHQANRQRFLQEYG